MYLSSYNLGDYTDKLKEMVPANNKVGYIGNALDSSVVDPVRKADRLNRNMQELKPVG